MLGRSVTLTIQRIGAPGAFLRGRPLEPDVLLPAAEVPRGARVGDKVEVFVYSDAEGRLVGTTLVPQLELGEVAFLEVFHIPGQTLKSCSRWPADSGCRQDCLVQISPQSACLS